MLSYGKTATGRQRYAVNSSLLSRSGKGFMSTSHSINVAPAWGAVAPFDNDGAGCLIMVWQRVLITKTVSEEGR